MGGETAYTNKGAVSPDKAGTPTRIEGITPGIYFTIGANVQTFTFIGAGINNVFGSAYCPDAFPAMEVLATITDSIQMKNAQFAAFAGGVGRWWTSVLRYKGMSYGPSMLQATAESFYLCNLMGLIGQGPMHGGDDCGPTHME